MFEVGVYGGSFNPLHQGHVRCILEATNQCRELHVIISEGRKRDEINIRVRYRWVYELTKHLGNVKLHILTDDAETKIAYASEYSEAGTLKVKEMVGKKIDIIFYGDDYNEESFYTKYYKESQIHYFMRDGISSTKIRTNPYAHREWLPNVVKSYFVKKVLLVRGKGVGKSTLTILTPITWM